MRVEGVEGDDRLESSPPTQAPSLTRRPADPPPPPPPPRAEELRYGDTCTYFSILSILHYSIYSISGKYHVKVMLCQ